MKDPKQNKRRLLTAGVGVAVYTAFEGLACGNPIEPRCPTEMSCVDARVDAPVDGRGDARVDADVDADVDGVPDADTGGLPDAADPALTGKP